MIVREDPAFDPDSYASVPMAFESDVVMEADGLSLSERPLPARFVKDYDAIAGESPRNWPSRFDLSAWRFFGAWDDHGVRIGSAAMVMRSPELHMLEGRDDLAVLWDIRVAPEAQRSGAGTALLAAVEETARARGARELKVETQDVNAAACRFYRSQGFRLTATNRRAYVQLAETQLIWQKNL